METKAPLLEDAHVLRVSCHTEPFLKSLNATKFICTVLSIFKLQTFSLPFLGNGDILKNISMYGKPKGLTRLCLVCLPEFACGLIQELRGEDGVGFMCFCST